MKWAGCGRPVFLGLGIGQLAQARASPAPQPGWVAVGDTRADAGRAVLGAGAAPVTTTLGAALGDVVTEAGGAATAWVGRRFEKFAYATAPAATATLMTVAAATRPPTLGAERPAASALVEAAGADPALAAAAWADPAVPVVAFTAAAKLPGTGTSAQPARSRSAGMRPCEGA